MLEASGNARQRQAPAFTGKRSPSRLQVACKAAALAAKAASRNEKSCTMSCRHHRSCRSPADSRGDLRTLLSDGSFCFVSPHLEHGKTFVRCDGTQGRRLKCQVQQRAVAIAPSCSSSLHASTATGLFLTTKVIPNRALEEQAQTSKGSCDL